MILTIIAFILILGLLIFVHEMGHFITAKASGVKVEEFGLGFPPRLFAIKRGETEYSLNLIPLGGFVKMLGEEDPHEPRSLASKGIRTRLLVLSAGSVVMLLLPFILFPIGFMLPHEVIVGGEGVQVVGVAPDSPAATAGIEADDVIVSADGEPIETPDDLSQVIDSKLGLEVTLVLLRDSEEVEKKLVPRVEPPPGEGAIGITITWMNLITESRAYPPWEAIPLGVKQGGQMFVMMRDGIASLIRGDEPLVLTGVIGIAQLTSEMVKGGITQLIIWACFLSINLGIINLLPIPALDGGRIVFVLLEWVRRGKRVSPRQEGLVHLIGFMLLIALIIVVSYFDIMRIIRGESLFR